MRAEAQTQPALWAVASRLTLGSIDAGRATLLGPASLVSMANKIAGPKLADLFTRHGGASFVVVVQPDPNAADTPEAAPEPVPAPAVAAIPAAGKAEAAAFAPGEHPADHPLVKRVQQVLGARVTRVTKRPGPGSAGGGAGATGPKGP